MAFENAVPAIVVAKQGIAVDIGKLTPDSLEEVVEQLRDLQVDVDHEHAKVRVFCE